MHNTVPASSFTVTDVSAGDQTLIGVARVSTDAQDAQLQHDALGLGTSRPEPARKRLR